jgi:hypothetical protein
LKKIFTLLFLWLALKNPANAQTLTGTWEGDIDGYEFLQVNIVQIGDNLCGYSWDYIYNNKQDYCRAYFSGTYNKTKGTWFLDGYSFMENSGGHSLMQMNIKKDFENGETILRGLLRIKPSLFYAGGAPSEIRLKKKSNRPARMTQPMQDCLKEYESKQTPIIKPQRLPKKETPIIKTTPPSPKKKDSLLKIIDKTKPKDTLKTYPAITIKNIPPKQNSLPQQTNGRINKEISRIAVTDRKIKLDVYDNGTIDGDTVSIFYNGKMIMSHQRLSGKPIEIEVTLDENSSLHSIVLFAENLGSIPPNTALIIFTTPTGKRYELFSSATLQQNAELVFEYKPK